MLARSVSSPSPVALLVNRTSAGSRAIGHRSAFVQATIGWQVPAGTAPAGTVPAAWLGWLAGRQLWIASRQRISSWACADCSSATLWAASCHGPNRRLFVPRRVDQHPATPCQKNGWDTKSRVVPDCGATMAASARTSALNRRLLPTFAAPRNTTRKSCPASRLATPAAPAACWTCNWCAESAVAAIDACIDELDRFIGEVQPGFDMCQQLEQFLAQGVEIVRRRRRPAAAAPPEANWRWSHRSPPTRLPPGVKSIRPARNARSVNSPGNARRAPWPARAAARRPPAVAEIRSMQFGRRLPRVAAAAWATDRDRRQADADGRRQRQLPHQLASTTRIDRRSCTPGARKQSAEAVQYARAAQSHDSPRPATGRRGHRHDRVVHHILHFSDGSCDGPGFRRPTLSASDRSIDPTGCVPAFPAAAGAVGVGAASVSPTPAVAVPGGGNILRSPIPHRLEAMKYTHRPAGTLKNMTPMKIIMYFIMFCCMRVCSSVAGGVNIFCCQMNRMIVMIGKMFRIGTQPPRFARQETRQDSLPVPSLIGPGQIRTPLDAGNQRRLPQLDVDRQAAVEPDENRQLEKHQPAASERVEVVSLPQLTLGLRLLLQCRSCTSL